MKVLIIGNGGREHALAWKLAQSKEVTEIYVTPINTGISCAESVDIKVTDTEGLLKFAKEHRIDLTIVGPEIALENGIVNVFKEEGLKIFGPTKEAALIETSKLYAKELMKKYQIPTANYQAFVDYDKANHFIKSINYPIVIKADNLAYGKGVIIVKDEVEAKNALSQLLVEHQFNCREVIIEEFLQGVEFSLMAFVKGEKVYPMVLAKDHKRAFDNDFGPNTGGMGAYSGVPLISPEVVNEALNNIMIPCAKALVKENRAFEGVLYGGLMLTEDGVKVIEFNARFGDPETEVVLPRLKNDLYVLINDLLEDKEINLEWDDASTLGVVLASIGYPGNYERGKIIDNIDRLNDVLVFHMGTKQIEGKVLTNGGRVLIVVGKGHSIDEARKKVYSEITKIKCDNLFYRNDIGIKKPN